MSIILKDFYHQMKEHYKLKLIAGKDGLTRSFNWMYLAEDVNTTGFLNGDEIIITTGLSSQGQDDWLKNLLLKLIDRGCPCLIVNTGQYLTEDDLTGELLSLCDRHCFPLLTMPWEMHLAELFQDCSNLIFETGRKTEILRSALRRIIHEKQISAETADILENCGYKEGDFYCLSILDLDDRNSSISSIIRQMQQTISSFLYRESFFAFSYQTHFIIIGRHSDKTTLEKNMPELLSSFQGKSFYAGISSSTDQLIHLELLYRQAGNSLVMAKSSGKPVFRFDDFGYYKIFFSVSNKQVLYDFYRSCIGEIEDYDALHQSSYLDTLESYLRNNGQLSVIAMEMNCHRNTVYYRAVRLKEWLQLDLNDGARTFQLQMALNIRKYLDIFQ